MNVLLVGCGRWGMVHAKELRKLIAVQVVGAVDAIAERRQQVTALWPQAQPFATLDDVTLADVDVVCIATPAATHASLAIAAVGRWPHAVFVIEKPMASDMEQAAMLLEHLPADRTVIDHTYAYHPLLRTMEGWATKLDGPRYVRSMRTHCGMVRADVPVHWDLALHDLVLVEKLAGRPIAWVEASGRSLLGDGRMDVMTILPFDAQVRAMGIVYVSWVEPMRHRELTVIGPQGAMAFHEESHGGTVILYGYGQDMSSVHPAIPQNTAAAGEATAIGRLWMQVRTVFMRQEPPAVTMSDGLRLVRQLVACDRAIHSGRREAV